MAGWALAKRMLVALPQPAVRPLTAACAATPTSRPPPHTCRRHLCTPAVLHICTALQGSEAESESFFADLGTYLTLERAQRLYGFQAERFGLDDGAAAGIAAVFARVGVVGGRGARLGGWVRVPPYQPQTRAAAEASSRAALFNFNKLYCRPVLPAISPCTACSMTPTTTACCPWTSSAACAPRSGWS